MKEKEKVMEDVIRFHRMVVAIKETMMELLAQKDDRVIGDIAEEVLSLYPDCDVNIALLRYYHEIVMRGKEDV